MAVIGSYEVHCELATEYADMYYYCRSLAIGFHVLNADLPEG